MSHHKCIPTLHDSTHLNRNNNNKCPPPPAPQSPSTVSEKGFAKLMRKLEHTFTKHPVNQSAAIFLYLNNLSSTKLDMIHGSIFPNLHTQAVLKTGIQMRSAFCIYKTGKPKTHTRTFPFLPICGDYGKQCDTLRNCARRYA